MEGSNDIVELGKKTRFKSGEEAAEKGRKGGINSVKKRRDKRNFRETLMDLLSLPDMDKDGTQKVSPISGKPMSIRESIIVQALKQAQKGNVKALQTILDVMGERTFKIESDVTVRADKYDGMTDDELRAEAARLAGSIENP